MSDRKDYFRNYYRKHKEKLNSQMRLVYARDRELQNARSLNYRLNNKFHTLEYARDYRNKHRVETNKKIAEIKSSIEYRIYKRLKRKYDIYIPISLIREIRDLE